MRLNWTIILVSLLVLMVIITPRIAFGVSPTVVQVKANDGSAVTTLTTTFTSSPSSGNIILAFVLCLSGNCGTTNVPTDSLGNTYQKMVQTALAGGSAEAILYGAINKATGADSVTATFGMSVSFGLHIYEVSGSTVGYTIHQQTGTTLCGCSVGSYSPPSNTVTIVGAVSNGNPAGVWTFTGSMTGTSGPNFDIDASQWGTLTGAQTFPMSMNQALANWAEIAISFNIPTPANNSYVVEGTDIYTLNMASSNPSCNLNYSYAGNTIIMYNGVGGGGGQTFSTPTDDFSDSFTLQSGLSTISVSGAFYNVYTATVSQNELVYVVKQAVNSMTGHAAINMICYQVETTSGAFTFNSVLIQSGISCQSASLCSFQFSSTPAIFGAFNINEGTGYLAGTSMGACPTPGITEVSFGGTKGLGDSKTQSFCNADPGASSNKAIQLDSYGGASYNVLHNPDGSTYAYMANLTAAGTIAGPMNGGIFGVSDGSAVTSTITGWLFPNFALCPSSTCGVTVSWIFGFMALLFPMTMLDSFVVASGNISRDILIFTTLLGLFIGALLGLMLGYLPLPTPFIFGILFIVYVWKGRG